ncbi:MAG: HI1506-related protein [bacterium]
MLRIVSKKEGFCRCGVRHSEKPVDYPDGRFTDEQVARLKADPMLIVLEIPAQVSSQEDASAANGKLEGPVADDGSEPSGPAKGKKGK